MYPASLVLVMLVLEGYPTLRPAGDFSECALELPPLRRQLVLNPNRSLRDNRTGDDTFPFQ